MNDQQFEELMRHLRSVNKNLLGVGCLLVGLLVAVLALVFIAWKASGLRW